MSKISLFTTTQITEMKEIFEGNAYPNKTELEKIAKKFGLKRLQIAGWFGYERKRRVKTGELEMLGVQGRTSIFSPSQIGEMTRCFNEDAFPPQTELQRLATKFGMKRPQVYGWFTYERKIRAKNGKLIGQSHASIFTPRQKTKLKTFIKGNPYPQKAEIEEIARIFNLKTVQINNWFVTERAKNRRLAEISPTKVDKMWVSPEITEINDQPIKSEYIPHMKLREKEENVSKPLSGSIDNDGELIVKTMPYDS